VNYVEMKLYCGGRFELFKVAVTYALIVIA